MLLCRTRYRHCWSEQMINLYKKYVIFRMVRAKMLYLISFKHYRVFDRTKCQLIKKLLKSLLGSGWQNMALHELFCCKFDIVLRVFFCPYLYETSYKHWNAIKISCSWVFVELWVIVAEHSAYIEYPTIPSSV